MSDNTTDQIAQLSQTVADLGPSLKDVAARVVTLNDMLNALQLQVTNLTGAMNDRAKALEDRVSKIENYLSNDLVGQISSGNVSFSP